MDNDDLMAVKLHVDNSGIVWSLFSDGPAECTNKNVIDYLLSLKIHYPVLRLVGCANNAHLLLALNIQRYTMPDTKIEICSPGVCRTRRERDEPQQVLNAMRLSDKTGSMGGWHVFKPVDSVTYALISQVQKTGKYCTPQTLDILKKHPAWPALSFIPNINQAQCVRLITTIIDPRWFIDLKHPGRGSKLRRYLGLNLNSVVDTTAFSPNINTNVYTNRCFNVINCWYDCTKPEVCNEPGSFPDKVRRLCEYKTGNYELGVLRGCQIFVEYLRLSWLAELNINGKQSEAMFIPEYFFKRKEEIAAFKTHMQKALKNEQL